ncbi:CxC2 domain-containing protein [Mycena indigotica]|uniref:CxC2 domain-containing protein n=1 Tax=Mycena indigotica TaxID=2126181 RepID=A0A8H6WF79_9AGAR|nr:CxC2 domain-containing protein [Mycena indigotica]KAF7310254.1 CxC2 domain-containing protein [Mycena indigotica]
MSRKRRAPAVPRLVRHHITPMEQLIGAPPDAPLPTVVHRLTNDNRRLWSQTVLVEPTSPVKRARIQHLERVRAPALSTTNDPERYEMNLGVCEDDDSDTEMSKPRFTQPADKAMHQWTQQSRDIYLQAMLWREGRGNEGTLCHQCQDATREALYRCRACYGGAILCQQCCVATHQANPLHDIESWTGVYFVKTSLRDLGLRIQFGHRLGERCRSPRLGRADFVVIAGNGIHEVSVDFCGCEATSDPNYLQLLKAGWYPSTTDAPRTCATFSCLDTFHYLSLHGKTTAYDYYSALESLTDGTGIKPPNRYSIFMRISRQYRHLLLLKRMGRGHDKYGVLGTGPGELAIRCPACPRPGVNLPEGWENASPEDRCLYIMFIAMDACFSAEAQVHLQRVAGPGTGDGLGVYARDRSTRGNLSIGMKKLYLCDFEDEYLHVTGVGMGVCARHEFVLPNGVGDLQAGERYVNMDYIFGSFIRHIDPRLFKIISYDIVCQWIKTLIEPLEFRGLELDGTNLMTTGLSGIGENCWVSPPFYDVDLTEPRLNFEKQEQNFELLTVGHIDRVPDWKRQVEEFEADNEKPNPYQSSNEGLTETAVRKMYEEEEAAQEQAGIMPIHDVSPTEFISALLDAEADQRRIRGLADLKRTRGSIGGLSLRQQRRKLNRAIKRLRTLQATYTPAALRKFESLNISQDTLAERVPLLPPSSLSSTECENGGCRDGLLQIEQSFREAQCRSSLTALQLQLHVKARLLTYKKNNARAQAMNTRSRTLVDQNERKILLHSEKYQTAWRALVAIAGGEDKIIWRQLHKSDIRCMEEPEEVQEQRRKDQRAELEERIRAEEMRRAGLPDLPVSSLPMEDSDQEDGEDEIPVSRSDRLDAARERNALFKHGESRRSVSWIWSNVVETANGVEEGHVANRMGKILRARTRRWREEVRILEAEWLRLPLSFGAEEALWAQRGAGVDISNCGVQLAEGMIAYAAKHADMYRNLSRRAEVVRTKPILERGHRGEREINEVYTMVQEDDAAARADGVIDTDDEDEHGNESDEEDD